MTHSVSHGNLSLPKKGGNAENGVYMLDACTCRCYHHIGVYVQDGTCISCANITVLMTLFRIGSL